MAFICKKDLGLVDQSKGGPQAGAGVEGGRIGSRLAFSH